MTRIITVASGKGGVGKTTIATNLAASMHDFGVRVLLMDTNLTTPNMGFHLGVPLHPKTIHDVLRGEAKIHEAIFIHSTGLHLVPAGISISDLKTTDPSKLSRIVLDLVGDYETIIMDGSAGLGKESIASLEAADDVLIVTNPNIPAVTDALKAIKISEEFGTNVLGVVLNRVTNKKSELSVEDVESLLGYPVVSVIRENPLFHDSLAAKTPLVYYAPSDPEALKIKKLAADIVGINWEPPSYAQRQGFLSKLLNLFR